jgi:predicted unusual protein kinase regulating ubiquinone biosynthesis (AarF/ABC1/UbiB family)
MAKDDSLPTSRLARFGKLASLSARIATEVAGRGLKLAQERGEGFLSKATAEKMVDSLSEMKGLAMKLGQQWSMDPDLLSAEARTVLARLQNKAPPMPFSTVKKVLEQELGDIAKHFATFEEVPVAAASLGQVHRATLKNKTQVAVKIQYPNIDKTLTSDLANLRPLVSIGGRAAGIENAQAYFTEMHDALMAELDYRAEGQRLEEFATCLSAIPEVTCPKYFEKHSSGKVMTMSFLSGMTLKDFIDPSHLSHQSVEEKFRVSRLLILAVWAPFLTSKVIHADPHPGNFMLLSDGRIGVLDFGALKTLSVRWHQVHSELFTKVTLGQPYDAMKICEAAGFEFANKEKGRLFVDICLDVVTRPPRVAEFDFGTSGLTRELRQLFLKHAMTVKSIRPPPEALQFFRAIGGLTQNLETIGAKGDFKGIYDYMLNMPMKNS